MAKKYFLGLDQGTTGTTSLILDENWNIYSHGYKEHTQYYPKPGWVEHDPMEIWEKIKESIAMAFNQKGLKVGDLKAIGLDNQGETVMIWDKNTGKPIYNAIVWQDRRTAKMADELKEEWGEVITEKTGLVVDAYFSALKIKWILENIEGAKNKAEKGELLAGTIDTWLIWKMTAGEVHMTDYSTASRTMLLNIHTGKWDDEIIKKLDIPKNILPIINDSSMIYGYTSPNEFFGAKIPIAGSVVDQQAALFGQACFEAGSVKTTYGTGCFMLMNTGDKIVTSPNGLLTTVAWGINKKMSFALDGGVYITGAAVQWLRDGIKIINSAAETEALAKSVPDTGGLYFVPAFVGLAAPYWDQYARGMMIGITGGTTRAHVVRATLESIAFQVKEILDVMKKDSGIPIDVMRVDGGAVVNEFLMQFQADLLGIPVDVPVINETTALGAAYLAALGIGEFNSLGEISSKWKLLKRYEPTMNEDKRQELCAQWKKAVERSRNWAEE
ncbi:MAG: glycerol kinase [Clostridiales bacterium]|jgi:glycerol kinase|nr:glycerol kinase [Clostridiales bacterium]MDK2933868.1 glycerol kinase [Clostridiales bacterium]